ncbi:N-6 DNA methylase [Hydrogenivirga sp.]
MREEVVSSALEYIRRVKTAQSEAQIRDELRSFLRELLGDSGDIRSIQVERTVRHEGIAVGRVDLAVESVVIEVKKRITHRSRKEALSELEKYLSSDEFRTSPFGILTDGIRFEVYDRENLKKPIDTFAFPEEEDIRRTKEVLYRLDRYVLSPQRVPLTSERIIDVLGYNSLAFRSVYGKLRDLFEDVKDRRENRLKLEEWKKYMNFVYGSQVEEDLFFRHTYLSVVVKLLAVRLLGLSLTERLLDILSGKFFEDRGIKNYIAKDFFSWILNEEIVQETEEIARDLLHILESKFEFDHLTEEVEEDLLKELYQNIVTREERQLLGEYYTPDWLVQRILEDLMRDPSVKVLDPSCGSGSFLFFAIKKKRERFFEDPQEKLEHILNTVVGIDVNPIATLIAKTNYLIALGELLRNRREDIYLPVYTADSLLAFVESAQRELFGRTIKVSVNESEVRIPLYEKAESIDRAIDLAVEFAISEEEDFQTFLRKNYPQEKAETPVKELANDVKRLVEEKGDSIWAFIFKNIYKPVFFKERFDLIVGNPPWLVYNRMHTGLQRFVNDFMKAQEIKVAGHNKLNIDIALIFFVSCFLNFLKENGTIAFVLPYAVFSGDQHLWFRTKNRYSGWTLEFVKVYDLSEVSPLFNVPSCVVAGKKVRAVKPLQEDIPAIRIKGRLPKSNVDISVAGRKLEEEPTKVHVVKHSEGKVYWSYDVYKALETVYAERFKKGAELIPRPFWFVEVEETPLGKSEHSVPVFSKPLGDEKLGVVIRGSVPERFFFKTLLSKRVYPFGYTEMDDVILPLEIEGDSYRLLDYYELTKGKSFKSAGERFKYWIENSQKLPRNFKEWLIECQKIWEEWRGEKARSHNIIDWLNYRNKLTSQPVRDGYLVLYTAHGSNPSACVVENGERFVVDHMNFYANFERKEEALYVASFINSSTLLRKIREYQSRGLYGERHIHKLIVEQPIPQYDPSDELHRELVEVAKTAQEKAKREPIREWLKSAPPNRIRTLARIALEFELNEIDRIVAGILREPKPPPIERLVLLLDTDDDEGIKKALKKFQREINLSLNYRLLPARVALVKYNPIDQIPEGLRIGVEFSSSISDILVNIYILLKLLSPLVKKAFSIYRRGKHKELKEYQLPL